MFPIRNNYNKCPPFVENPYDYAQEYAEATAEEYAYVFCRKKNDNYTYTGPYQDKQT